MADVKYSLKAKSIEVPIEQVDGGVVVYEVRRVAGSVVESYLDERQSRVQTTYDADAPEKATPRVKIESHKDVFVSLLKRCLYRDNQLVPAADIAAFPFDVQKGLFEDAKAVNGLTDESAAKSKN